MYTWLGAHSGRPVLHENGQVAGQGTRGKPSDSDDQGTLMGSRRGVDASPAGGGGQREDGCPSHGDVNKALVAT